MGRLNHAEMSAEAREHPRIRRVLPDSIVTSTFFDLAGYNVSSRVSFQSESVKRYQDTNSWERNVTRRSCSPGGTCPTWTLSSNHLMISLSQLNSYFYLPFSHGIMLFKIEPCRNIPEHSLDKPEAREHPRIRRVSQRTKIKIVTHILRFSSWYNFGSRISFQSESLAKILGVGRSHRLAV